MAVYGKYHSCSKPAILVYVEILTVYFASQYVAGAPAVRELFRIGEEPKWCTFENDTKYSVMITDKDGTRALDPGKSTTNYDIPAGSHVILVLKLPKTDKGFWDQYQYLSNGPPTPPLTHSIIEQDFYKTSKMEDKKNDEYSALCLHSI